MARVVTSARPAFQGSFLCPCPASGSSTSRKARRSCYTSRSSTCARRFRQVSPTLGRLFCALSLAESSVSALGCQNFRTHRWSHTDNIRLKPTVSKIFQIWVNSSTNEICIVFMHSGNQQAKHESSVPVVFGTVRKG